MEDYRTPKWSEWQALFKDWKRLHREVPGQFVKLSRRYTKYEYDYYKLISEYRQTRNPNKLNAALEILNQAEQEMKVLSRMEFLASLSK